MILVLQRQFHFVPSCESPARVCVVDGSLSEPSIWVLGAPLDCQDRIMGAKLEEMIPINTCDFVVQCTVSSMTVQLHQEN